MNSSFLICFWYKIKIVFILIESIHLTKTRCLMWFVRLLQSSIGKKMIMAATGMLLFLFLLTHVAGNATIYMSSAVFQSYADELHSHPLIVLVFSLSLLGIVLVHAGMGLFLFFQNREEGTSRYAVSTRVVKNSLASRTMAYSGIFIFIFLLIHVAGFTFRDGHTPISVTVQELLGGFFYGLFYITSFMVLALHLNHGFWSMLQTFGFNHPRYNTFISKLTYILPIFFLVMFSGIPLYFMTGMGANY